MPTELQNLITSLTLVQKHSPKASIELHNEELCVFDVNIKTMTKEQRKELLDANYFSIIKCDGGKEFFLCSQEQREDGDYTSFDSDLKQKED